MQQCALKDKFQATPDSCRRNAQIDLYDNIHFVNHIHFSAICDITVKVITYCYNYIPLLQRRPLVNEFVVYCSRR